MKPNSSAQNFAAAALGISTVFATSAAPAAETNAPRLNVLLILADDLGWSDLGCMGGEIDTPNIDALSNSGLTFTQFYNSARCSPTRASLLTGLTPHQAGVANIGPALSPRAVTLPEVLTPAGYTTSMVGKWHLTERNTPIDRGFGEFYGMLGASIPTGRKTPISRACPPVTTKSNTSRTNFMRRMLSPIIRSIFSSKPSRNRTRRGFNI